MKSAGDVLRGFSKTTKLTMALSGAAITAALGTIAAATVKVGQKAFDEFDRTRMSLEELRASYSETADDWVKWSGEMQRATTYSDEAFQAAASGMRTLVQSYGMGEDQVRTLIESSADLAALKGIDLAGASERLQAAMRGEAESAEFLGLTLNDTFMANMAFNGELRDTWGTLTDAEKAQYRYQEALNQMAYAQGQAQKRSKTFRGAMAQIKNVMQDAWAQVGEKVAPALDDLGVQMGTYLPGAIRQAADWMGDTLPRAITWMQKTGGQAWTWIKGTAIPQLREWGTAFKTDVLPKARELVTNGLGWLLEKGQAAWAWITETAIPKLREWGEAFKTDVLPKARELVTNGLGWLLEKGQAAWAWISETAIPKLKEWGEVFKTDVLPKARELVTNGLGWLLEKGQAAWDWITGTAIPKLQEWGETFKTDVLPKVRELVTNGLEWLREKGGTALETAKEKFQLFKDKVLEVWNWLTGPAKEKLAEFADTVEVKIKHALLRARVYISLFRNKLEDAWNWFKTDGVTAIIDWASSTKERIESAVNDFMTGFEPFKQIIQDTIDQGLALIGPAIDDLKIAFQELLVELGLTGEKTGDLNIDFEALGKFVGETIVTGIRALTIIVLGFVTALKKLFEFIGKVKNGMEAWGGVFDNIGTIFEGIDLPDWLKPGSPPPLATALWSIADAIHGMPDLAEKLAMPSMAGAGAAGAMGGAGAAAGQTTVTDNRQSVTMYGAQFNGVQDAGGLLAQLQALAG
jgi:hypothetical protein